MIEGFYTFLSGDHDRLDGLLHKATAVPGRIDRDAYDEFRRGLLRHIAMEERVIFPVIAKQEGGSELVGRLRLDHGAIAALLVPPPGPAVIATLLSILEVHNAREEAEEGVYRLIDSAAESKALLEKMKATPEVPAAPYNEKSGVLDATRRAVARAGYAFLDGV